MSNTVFERVYEHKWRFVALFTLIYFITLVALSMLGVSPLSNTRPLFTDTNITGGGSDVAVANGELPVRVEIPKLGLRATVANPASSDIQTLDAALLGGAVRYPGSGVPGEKGNVVLFGHSSHLPVVHNQAYRAFNDIQNLKEGDPIFVIGETEVYVYVVEKVEEATAVSDAIPLNVSGAKLTLATCNNFGTKEDRFIVTATLVKVDDLSTE